MFKFVTLPRGWVAIHEYESAYIFKLRLKEARQFYKSLLNEGFYLDNSELDGFEFMFREREDLINATCSKLSNTIRECAYV